MKTLKNMKIVQEHTSEVLETLYVVSYPTYVAVKGCIEAITTLTKELENEMKTKNIETDENLQGMIFQYAKATQDCEEVFANALKICNLAGLDF